MTLDAVRRASWLAMLAGGDFIKTSTGKISPAATLPVCLVMMEAVRDFRTATGRQVGVKPAGGIRTTKDAIKHLVLVNETAGPDWLTPDRFRIGASSLLNDLLLQRQKLRTGHYSGPDHVSVDLMTTPPSPAQPSTAFEYAPAPESRSIVDIAPSYGLFVDGEFVDGSGEAMKTVDPATEEVLSEIAVGTEADVDRAVKAARRAFTRVWGPMRPADRGKYLFRIARLLQERAREFAVLESLDNGKPIRESRDVDVPLAAAHFFYHAGWADKLEHAGLGPAPRPLGVAGQVIPWNFPLLMLAWKVAPALATGNTVVLKPAETTPLTALLFAEVCRQADLPPGVVNIVTGAGDTGRAVVEHDDVDKVAFTGSTEVGRSIARAVAGTAKLLTLELGGKAANIVFDDAPIDQAVEGIVQGIFFNQGHVCCAGSRLLVQENVHDEVVGRRCSGGSAPCASGTRWTRTPTSARSTPPSSSRGSGSCPTSARQRAPPAGSRPAICPTAASVPADRLHRRLRRAPDRPRRGVRPGAVGAHLPHARRSGGQGEQHHLRAVGRHLVGEGLADPRHRRQAARRRRLGQHVQPVRPVVALRRATSSPGTAARAAARAGLLPLDGSGQRVSIAASASERGAERVRERPMDIGDEQ